jgi:chromosome segregation ATPase
LDELQESKTNTTASQDSALKDLALKKEETPKAKKAIEIKYSVEIKKICSEIESCSAKLAEAEASFLRKKEKVELSGSELEKLNEEKTRLKEQLEEKKRLVENKQTSKDDLKKLSDEVLKLNSEIDSKKKALEPLTAQNNRALNNAKHEHQSLLEKRKPLEDRQNQLIEACKNLPILEGELEDLKAKKKTNNDKLQQQTSDELLIHKAHNQAETDKGNVALELAELRKSKTKTTASRDDALKDLGLEKEKALKAKEGVEIKCSSKIEKIHSESQKAVSELDSKIESCSAKLTKIEADFLKTKEELELFRSTLDKLKNEETELNRQLEEKGLLVKNKQTSKSELKKLSDEMSKLDSEIGSKKKAFELLIVQNNRALDNAKQKHQSLLGKRQSLEGQQKQLMEACKDLQVLEAEFQALKAKKQTNKDKFQQQTADELLVRKAHNQAEADKGNVALELDNLQKSRTQIIELRDGALKDLALKKEETLKVTKVEHEEAIQAIDKKATKSLGNLRG